MQSIGMMLSENFLKNNCLVKKKIYVYFSQQMIRESKVPKVFTMKLCPVNRKSLVLNITELTKAKNVYIFFCVGHFYDNRNQF